MNSKTILILFLMFSALCKAQHPFLDFPRQIENFTKFKNYTPQEGLEKSTIFDIIQDKRGFLWLATTSGLVRFDGDKFIYFNHAKNDSCSIPDDRCMSLAEDTDGNIWVGTLNGLGCFNPVTAKCKQYHVAQDSSTLILRNEVRALLICSDGYLWAEQIGGVLSQINLDKRTVTHYKRHGLEKTTINNFFVFETSDNKIIAGGGNNLAYCFNKKKGGHVLLRGMKERKQEPFYTPTDMIEDQNGDYWITSQDNGLVIYNSKTGSLSTAKDASLMTIEKDKQGNIWAGGVTSGLIKIDRERKMVTRFLPNKNYYESLPSRHITKIFIDDVGNIWIGHTKGLSVLKPFANKFGGVWHIPETPSPPSNSITAICQTNEQELWFGTTDMGAFVYTESTKEFKSFKGTPEDANSISSNWVTGICVDADKQIWFSLWNGHTSAVNRFNGEKQNFTRFRTPDNYFWFYDVECNNNTIFVGSWGTAILESNIQDVKFEISFPGQRESKWPYGDATKFLNNDSDGNIWSGSKHFFNPNNNSFALFFIEDNRRFKSIRSSYYSIQARFGVMPVKQIVTKGNEVCQLCTPWSLLLLNPKTHELTQFRLPEREYHSINIGFTLDEILVGATDTILISNVKSGFNCELYCDKTVGKVNAIAVINHSEVLLGCPSGLWRGIRKKKHQLSVERIDSAHVKFIEKLNNSFAVVNSNGLYLYNEESWGLQKPKSTQSLNSEIVENIVSSEESLIIALRNGVGIFNSEKDSFVEHASNPTNQYGLTSSVVYNVCAPNDSIVWVVGNKGVASFNRNNACFTNYLTPSSNVLTNWLITDLMFDRNGFLWAGTSHGWGVNKINVASGEIEHYVNLPYDSTSFSGNVVNQIFEDKSGNIWIATDAGLLKNITGTKSFQKFDRNNGLAGDETFAILEDDNGNLWTSHPNGLSRINLNTGIVKVFSRFDGTQTDGYLRKSCAKLFCGRLAFGGYNGATIFHPDSLPENRIKARSFVTSVKVNGIEIFYTPPTSLFELEYSQRNLEFSFGCSDFSIPERTMFYYVLERNGHREFSDTTKQTHVVFDLLRSGDYKLFLSSTNCDGLWGDLRLVAEFKISTPFWLTWWFFCLIILAMGGLIYAAIVLRDNYLSDKKRKLEAEIVKRTLDLHALTKAIVERKEQVQELNNSLVDNLEYARFFQDKMLQTARDLEQIIPNCSIKFCREGLISNQFYWGQSTHDGWFAAVGESTIQGVLGGIVSMQILSLLKETVINQKCYQPEMVLHQLNKKILTIFKGDGSKSALPASVNIGLCAFNSNTENIHYAGANTSIGLFQKNGTDKTSFKVLSGNKFKLDAACLQSEDIQTHAIQVTKSDTLVMVSGFEKLKSGGMPFKRAVVNITKFKKCTIDAHVNVIDLEIRKKFPNNTGHDYVVWGIRF